MRRVTERIAPSQRKQPTSGSAPATPHIHMAALVLGAALGAPTPESASLQPNPMATHSCPSKGPAKAVLYNHMGKTGGTPMKKFLMAATGCSKNITLCAASRSA